MPVKTSAVRGATVAGLLLVLGACGSTSTTQVGAGALTNTPAAAQGTQSVSFGSATFDVPAAWSVYDMTATPHRCARFDVHAVYRGHQASDAKCPARVLGKTDAVQVEANDSFAQAQVLPSAATSDVNGQAVAYEPGGEANHQIVATFPGLGVVLRVTYGADATVAQQIVASVHKTGP